MAGQLPRAIVPKDDCPSASPSVDDSGFVSMASDFTFHYSRDQAGQYMNPYLGHNLYSPSPSLNSRGVFPASVSEMGHFGLPSSTGASEYGDNYMAFQEVVNPSPTQMFSQPVEGSYQKPLEGSNNLWIEQDSQGSTTQRIPPFAPSHTMTSWESSQIFPSASPSALMTRQHSHEMEMEGPTATRRATLSHIRPTLQPVSQRSSTTSIPLTGASTGSVDRVSDNPSPLRALRRYSSTVGQNGHVDSSQMLSPTMSFASASRTPVNITATGLEDANARSTTGVLISATMTVNDRFDEAYSHDKSTLARITAGEEAARAHPLYQASAHSDDLYHCPFEAEDCGHKPTKLKCNYDKYIDSHLKPFRCKLQACVELQFSSTACLLRHEREAHGMHGHGSKPHLCSYTDCERSLPGSGFPRRYNLFDHMKRVHDYTGPTTSPDNVSPTESVIVPHSKSKITRKRKLADATEQTEKRSKTKGRTVPSVQSAQDRRVKEIQQLQTQWTQRLTSLQQRVQTMRGPQDITGHEQVAEDVDALQRVAKQLNDLG